MIAVYVHYNFELYIVYTCPTHKTVYNVFIITCLELIFVFLQAIAMQ